MSHIYALRLEKDKYYVGKTNRPELRLEEHAQLEGASWTKLYPPLDLLYIKESTSDLDEDLHVKQLMITYGIKNVRGGSYAQIDLTDAQIDLLIKEICSAKNLCFKCASSTHFATDCTKKKKPKKRMSYDKTAVCSRCGRKGHTKSHCFTKVKVDGKPIKVSHCSYCYSTKHKKNECMMYKLDNLA
jgi:hypothetical protein